MARNYKRIEQDSEYLAGAWEYARKLEDDYDGIFRIVMYPTHRKGVWGVKYILRTHHIDRKAYVDYIHERVYPTADVITLAGLILQGCSRTDYIASSDKRETPKRDDS